MDTFLVKKFGEVLAFATVGIETIEKYESVFRENIGVELTAHIIEMNNMHSKNILHYVQNNNSDATMMASKEKTMLKLSAMRDLYLGIEKNNVSELFEWYSFFEGAAYGHWMLIKGKVAESDNETLIELSEDASLFHLELLEHIGKELGEIGQDM